MGSLCAVGTTGLLFWKLLQIWSSDKLQKNHKLYLRAISLKILPLFSKTLVSHFKYCDYSFLFLGKPVVGGEIELFTESITGFAENIVLLLKWESEALIIWRLQDKDGLGNLLFSALWKCLLCSSAKDYVVKACDCCWISLIFCECGN